MGSQCFTLRSSTERLRLKGSVTVLDKEAKVLLKESAQIQAALAHLVPERDLNYTAFLQFLRDLRKKSGRRSRRAATFPKDNINTALKEAVEFQQQPEQGLLPPREDWQSVVYNLADHRDLLQALDSRCRGWSEKYSEHLKEVAEVQSHLKRRHTFTATDSAVVAQLLDTWGALKRLLKLADECVFTLNSFVAESQKTTDTESSVH